MRRMLVAALVVLAGCSSAPEPKVEKFKDNVVFRLGARKDAFEVRLESSYYSNSGYEIVTRLDGVGADGVAKDLAAGVTIVLEGVRVPLEPRGPAAPASAVLEIKLGKEGQTLDGVTFPLVFKIPAGEGSGQLDPYNVQHTAGGWRLSRNQGGFSRFESQGSF